MPAPARARLARAARPVCADASHACTGQGPASPGKNINPGHHSSSQGLRQGLGPPRWRRRTWLAGASARRDATRRGRQCARDLDEALTPHNSNMPFCRGIKPKQRCIRKGSNRCCLPRANTEPRLRVHLCPVSPSPDLAVLASSLGELAANVLFHGMPIRAWECQAWYLPEVQ